jgi:deoxyribonuclease-4
MPDLIRFGTVGSPQTTPQSGTPAAIEYTRLLGMDHLEIAWVQSVRVSDETCAAIKTTAEQHNITLSIHAPYYINLNSQTAELMQKSDERLLVAARKGYLAGARDIVFHPARITINLLIKFTNEPNRSCWKSGESWMKKG